MSENVDLMFLKRRVAELLDGSLPVPAVGMETAAKRDAESNEAHLSAIKTDLRYLRSGVATLDGAVAAMRERTAHLPSRIFIVALSLLSTAATAAIVIFQSTIQNFFNIPH